MKTPFAYFIRSNRSLFAVAVLCVLVIKGFGFLGMVSALGRHPQEAHQSFTIAVLGAHCDQHRDSDAPQDKHAHHTECCVLCSGATRDAALDQPASKVVVEVLTPHIETPPAAVVFSWHDPVPAYSTGMFSDWSPTAPPAV